MCLSQGVGGSGNPSRFTALAGASELYGYDEENVAAACIAAYDKTLALLEESRRQNRPPWLIIKELASERIFSENHPVAQARGYKFIGDIGRNFADWVKQRRLRNIVDMEPDKFSSYATDKARAVIG
jgi:hypothetical protein